jgi:hypothetical protein
LRVRFAASKVDELFFVAATLNLPGKIRASVIAHQSTNCSLRTRLGGVATAVAIAAATLWDFRVSNLRIFDLAAMVCLVGYVALCPEQRSGFFSRRRDFLFLFAVIVAYALLGLILNQHRSSAAILLLTATGYLLIGRTEWVVRENLFFWLIIFHAIPFLVQFFAFPLFDVMIDFQTIAGAHSRIDQGLAEGIHQIRASGLFQEPNSYSLNMFVLGTIVTLQGPSLLIVTLAAVTMALSQSLWGIAAACVLLLLYGLRYPGAGKRIVVAGLIFAGIVNAYLWLNLRPKESIPFVYDRVMRVFTDTSIRERFVINQCPEQVKEKMRSLSTPVRVASTVFGEGLSTRYFTECLAANGISFLFKSFGLVGLAALLVSFAMALRGLPASAKLYALVAIGFSFTTYPLVTYLLFWLWLAAVINLLRLDDADRPAAGTVAGRS